LFMPIGLLTGENGLLAKLKAQGLDVTGVA
jgi:hypothetical protein